MILPNATPSSVTHNQQPYSSAANANPVFTGSQTPSAVNPSVMPSPHISPWTITAHEHQQNEGQFVLLQPANGLVNGEQARPFFLKSGLPAHVLAQIWQLADMNKDGKLDRLEFTVAMKLVRNCLAGLPLPPILPESMRQIAPLPFHSASSGFSTTGSGVPMPMSMSQAQITRPLSTYGSMPSLGSIYNRSPYVSAAQTPTMTSDMALPFRMGTKELGDWSLPQPMKLRFCQHFNQLDRTRIGLLTGQQARGVLGESQLPTQLLAQIWNMSDVNKDGCLSIEEFCTAMFLIEMVKAGYALPSKLPNELGAFCSRTKTVSPCAVDLTEQDEPPQKGGLGHFKTFEDKRKDNLDKGEAELERRRQILREEEERRRAEIERREREETVRRELERQELERRREAAMAAERERELERERLRAAEEERLKAQREEARRRLEQERIKELEKIRLKDMENQLQVETEKSAQIQQKQHTMAFQLQALDESAQQLNNDITGARDTILDITKDIEGMRAQRDQKVARIQELEAKAREITVCSERFSHENLQLQSECQRQLSRTQEIEKLRKVLTETDEKIKRCEEEKENVKTRAANQEKLVAQKRPEFEKCQEMIRDVIREHHEILSRYNKARVNVLGQAAMAMENGIPSKMGGGGAGGALPSQIIPPKDNNTSLGNGFESSLKQNLVAEIHALQNQKVDEKRRKSAAGDLEWFLGRDDDSAKAKSSVPTSLSMESMMPHLARPPQPQQQQSSASAQPPSAAAAIRTIKYKALYEFNARSADELSLQPGDVVLVFEGHQSEPGWMAGQIRDKIGWFPAAFAEPLASNSVTQVSASATSSVASATTSAASQKKGGAASLTGSPSGEPLTSIKEEAEPALAGGTSKAQALASAFAKSVSMTDTSSSAGGPAAGSSLSGSKSTNAFSGQAQALPLYDFPPVDDQKLQKMSASGAVNSAIANTKAREEDSKPEPRAAVPLYEMPPMMATEEAPTQQVVLGTGVALYQWKGRNEQEVSFARGDIIEVLEQGEMRWRGRLQKDKNVQGWFPKSYVKLGGTLAIGGTAQSRQENRGPRHSLSVEEKNEAKRGESGGEKDGGEWFIALYQFDAVEPTDLSLKPGDRIWVTDQRDQWWRGTCEGKTGIFPANYVQRVVETDDGLVPNTAKHASEMVGRAIAAFDATASNQISLKVGDFVKVHQTTPGGWWEGELERDGIKHSGWFPGNYIQLVQSDGDVLAMAVFDYLAQREDELSFKTGDLLEISDRSDPQWWKGRIKGKSDQPSLLFPANFVRLQ